MSSRSQYLGTHLASTSDLTIHRVVRYSPDFYKPFEFLKVDQCPILREPWHANCFFYLCPVEQKMRNERMPHNRINVHQRLTPLFCSIAKTKGSLRKS